MSDNILDSVEIRGISADGDDRVTLIILKWEPSEESYSVERRCDGQYEDSQKFSCIEYAEALMKDWAEDARYHYQKERESYERGRDQSD